MDRDSKIILAISNSALVCLAGALTPNADVSAVMIIIGGLSFLCCIVALLIPN